ncbi:hypothetical protein LTR84_012742 [Exophiala bonariae]|uniref:Restriction of telomere capping protein 4 n=1 Tax=Exophiala bonariae TaxID=1690606 RepID=A0AAV9NF76_9EURO|nr:hypothetical protein LTR84_012742 [Exophiala bonariae]
MMDNDNEDYLTTYGPPLSSDEDDPNEHKPSDPTKTKPKILQAQTSSPKRAATTAASSRSKRRKIQDEPGLSNLLVQNEPQVDLFGPSWSSSGSQKNKRVKKYGQKNIFQQPEPVMEKTESVEKTPAFVMHALVNPIDKLPSSTKTFVPRSPVRRQGAEQNGGTKQVLVIADLPQAKSTLGKGGFQLPDLTPGLVSSTTSSTDMPSIFEDHKSPRGHSRSRSDSSSSLSSARSPSPLDSDIDLPPVSRRCPACRKFVTYTADFPIPVQLRTLSLQKQQQFCMDHQMAEAKDFWKQSKYPDIRWADLAKDRISKKLPLLRKVISRQRSSYYLDQLDHRIQGAKGNRRKLQLYLTQGVVDVAKPGYYGLRGSRIMVNAITESLTEALVEALQTDSAIRHAGVGAYVSAVLVPELTLLLVMEDMHVNDPAKGRLLLDQSSPVGVLLYPDDDHIERTEDDADV